MNKIEILKWKVILSVFFIIFTSLLGFTQNIKAMDFNLLPTFVHFLGGVVSGENLLVYGSFGAYLISTDGGKSWQQRSLSERGDILRMVNYNDTLWGILSDGFLLQSIDNGINWKKYFISEVSNDTLLDIAVNDNFVYLRSTKKIYRLSKDLIYLNFFESDLIKIPVPTSIYLISKIPYYPNYIGLSSIFCFNDKLLVAFETADTLYFSNRRANLLILNEDFSEYRVVELFDVIPELGYGFLSPTIVFNYNNKKVILIGGRLYSPDENLETFSYFFSDTSCMSESYYQPDTNMKSFVSHSFFFFKNTLLGGGTEPNKGMGFSFDPEHYSPPRLYLYRLYRKIGDSENCIFEPFGNYFKNKYYTLSYDFKYIINPISNVLFCPTTIASDSIVVKAGIGKVLLQTRDIGNSWELVSTLANGKPRFIINDSIFVYLNDYPYTNEIFVSKDYGATFYPTELFFNLDTTIMIIEEEEGTPKDTVLLIDTSTFFSVYEKTILFYMDEDGRGFWLGGNTKDRSKYPNFAYTYDFGRRFKFQNVAGFGFNSSNYGASNVVKINDKYFFSIGLPEPVKFYDTIFYVIHYLDTNFNESQTQPQKVKYIFIYYLLADNLKHFFMLCSVQDSNRLWRKHFEVRETNDSGKTSQTVAMIDEDLEIAQFYEHNKDSVFFTATNPARLYLFDRRRRVIDTLFQDDTINKALMMKIGNRWFLVGDGFIFENKDGSLRQWEEIEWDYGKPRFEEVIFKGNVAIAKLSDSIRPVNYYRIMLKSVSKVEEPKVEVRYYTRQFYATEAYPTPASNIVRSRVYWDGSFDLRESIDGVYDLMGNKIEGKERIRIEAKGETAAELIWECSGLPAGVYFIVVRHNGRSETIPVVIE